jgi:predicted peroxiredoxin
VARILYIGTHGTDDPTRAAFPFFLARGAVQAGHQAAITLMMDSVLLMKDTIAQNIQPVGLPSFKELLGFAVEHRIPVTV